MAGTCVSNPENASCQFSCFEVGSHPWRPQQSSPLLLARICANAPGVASRHGQALGRKPIHMRQRRNLQDY